MELLKHFVSPYTGSLYKNSETSKLIEFVNEEFFKLFINNRKGVCRKQHENLQIAFEKACDYGLIDHHIPHRVYDYSIYFDKEELADLYASDRNLRKRVSPF